MALRREQGKLRPAVMPADEQPFPSPAAPDPLATGRDSKGRLASSDAARALAKLPRARSMLPRAIRVHPLWRAHDKRRREWTRKRLAELARMFGGEVGHGVGAMVNAAGWLWFAGECAAEAAAVAGDVEGFRSAATLTGTARQHDLAAYELAAREAEARRRANPAPWPWLLPDEQGEPEEHRADAEPDELTHASEVES